MAKKARFRPAWFADAMVSALAQAGSVTALADKARIPRSSIDSWADGSLPNAEYVERILAFVGGDIRRALPGYEFRVGEDVAASMSVEVLGQVAAGSVTMEGTKRYTVEVAGNSWRTSRFWPLTHGRVVFLEVAGDSMTPDYQPGSLIACRAPVDPRRLPDATPCIFREGADGSTFKLLRRVKTRPETVVAEPLNRAHQIIPVTDRTRIDYVVLGSINLGR